MVIIVAQNVAILQIWNRRLETEKTWVDSVLTAEQICEVIQMNEYIDKKQAIDRIASCYCMDCEHSNGILCRACEHQDDMDLIDDMPAVDVQPVRYGRWIDIYEWAKMHDSTPSGMCLYYWCSECQEEQEKKSNFCPHCGARMIKDGEQNE